MDSPTFAILHRLNRVKQTAPSQWEAACPCHDDNEQSLCIGIGDTGSAVLFCQAGCSTPDVLRSINAGYSDLFPSRVDAGHGSNGHAGNGKSPGKPKPKLTATYDYHDATGNVAFQVCRFDPKDFKQRRLDPAHPGKHLWNMAGVERVLYRLPELLQAPVATPVYLCEGEKDADNLRRGGFIASTIPGGAGKWQASYGETLRGRHVILVPDIDRPSKVTGKRPGWEHVVKVGNALLGVAASVRVLDLPNTFPVTSPLTPKWDVSDWIAKAVSEWGPDRALETFKAATDAAKPWERIDTPADDEANEELTDPHRLARIYVEQNQHADGPTLRYWMVGFHRWNGRNYFPVSTAEIKAEITAVIKAEFNRDNIRRLKNFIATESKPLPPVAEKVTTATTNNVLQALTGIIVTPEHAGQPAWLDGHDATIPAVNFISLTNGLLNVNALLAGDQDHLSPHTPSFFSAVSVPYAFDQFAECPKWLAFVTRNLEQDESRINLLQEWFGYCLLPDTSQQKFLLMEGKGSNGKSVACAALTAMLGKANCSAVPLELFGDKFALSVTLGRLANIAAEVGEIDKFSEGYIKSFASGDRMAFEKKYQPGFEATPTARLVIATNNRPRWSDRSDGIWRRMLLLPFLLTIEEGQKVKGMDKADWWADSGECAGILMWAINGLARLRQQRQFTDPAVCLAAISDYRNESNPARSFLLDHYEPDEFGNVITADAYKLYRDWCESHGNKPFSSIQFGKEVVSVFPTARQGKVRSFEGNRLNGYHGIERKQPDFGDHDDETSENTDTNDSQINPDIPGQLFTDK